MELNPIVVIASFGSYLFRQRHDERCPGDRFQRSALHANSGRAACVGGHHPMIDRTASDMSPCSNVVDGLRGDVAEREPVEDPGHSLRAKALLSRPPRRRIEDGTIPAAPSLELLGRR